MIRSVYADGENWKTLYRLTDSAGTAYTQNGITSVVVTVYDMSVDEATDLYVLDDPAVSAVFYDTLQTSDGWDQDSYGFNFKHVITPTDLVRPDALVTVTGATYTDATKRITKTDAFADYTFTSEDQFRIISGTSVNPGWYPVASKESDSIIALTTDAGSNSSDVVGELRPVTGAVEGGHVYLVEYLIGILGGGSRLLQHYITVTTGGSA